MNLEKDEMVACPYCGEALGIVVDCTIRSQEYVEDCQVCCRPIQLSLTIDDLGELVNLQVKSDDE